MSIEPTRKTFKHFLFLWSGQLFSLLGSSVVQFVIVYWITIVTKSMTFLSIASFFAFLPQFIIMPIAGVFVDRWNRKIVMALADFFQALTTLGLIFMFIFKFENVWIVILINGLRGIFQAFHWPAMNAIIPIMVPKENLSRFNGLNYLFTGVVNTLGPLIASILLANFFIEQILWVDIITFLIAITPLLIIFIPKVEKKMVLEEKTSFWKDFKLGIKVLKVVPGLLLLLFVATMINFFGTPFNTQMPYYVLVYHYGTKIDYGMIASFMQLGFFIGSVIVITKKVWKHKTKIILGGIILGEIGHLALALAPIGAFPIIGFGGFLFAFIVPFVNTMFLTILQSTIPPETQGRAMSIVISIATAITPIAMIISGPIAEIIGIVPLFLAASSIDIAFVLSIWLFSKVSKIDYDNLPDLFHDIEI
ncbi:MAG: MFS transporter [Promethearchaeota archaeon]